MTVETSWQETLAAVMAGPEREWTQDMYGWNYRIGEGWVWLAKRPVYCDRGHWQAGAEGPLGIDHADSFPRYFMDLERAKLEMADWLAWRLTRLIRYREGWSGAE